MRILFIIYGLYGGGAERVASKLMNRLCEKHEVTVVLLNPRKKTEYKLDPRVHVELVTTGPLAMRANKIRHIKRARNIDVSIGFLEKGNYLNVKSFVGERTINSIRNHTSLKWHHKGLADEYGKMKRADRLADVLVCVSEDVARDQAEAFGIPEEKLVVINNWCDADDVRAQAAQPTGNYYFKRFCARHRFLIVATGRLDVQKGHQHALRAFKAFHDAHPDTGFVVLGNGKLNRRVKALATVLDIDDAVYFAGKVSNPFAYMTACDAFILPSLYEGFSNAVLEAFACGLPVIASDCIGVREQLAAPADAPAPDPYLLTDYGLITPLPTPDWPTEDALDESERGLLAALERVYGDPELRKRLVERGTERLEVYSPENIMPQWEALIEAEPPSDKSRYQRLRYWLS